MTVDPAGRSAAFRAVAETQPGCTPYDNHRPIFVRKRSAGQTLASLLQRVRPYSQDPSQMAAHRDCGWLTVDHKKPDLDQILLAGNIVRFVVPDTVEPEISPALVVLHEDDHLMVFHKPSPLPVHPSGRFNKNTLVWIGRQAWPDVTLKPVHRLDANTTGVLVCAKTSAAARALVTEFRERRVQKRYLARVRGLPAETVFSIEASITPTPSKAGTRVVAADGQQAHTEVRLLGALSDGTSLLEVWPRTGRTHQIRLHLQTAGLPIVGDAAYADRSATSAGFTQANAPLCLHAHGIGFPHPVTGEWVEFSAPVPQHFGPEAPPKTAALSPLRPHEAMGRSGE